MSNASMTGLLQQRVWPALLCSALLALTGCAALSGPATYRLFLDNGRRILVPPGVKDAGVLRRTFDARTSGNALSCNGREGGVEIRPRGRAAWRVTVERDVLREQPAGWLARWAGALEQRGCLAPGDGFGLATRVAQSVPLEFPLEQRLLDQDARSSSYTDLRPGYKLRVVGPAFREGAPPGAVAIGEGKVSASGAGLNIELRASLDLIGYETAWYAVEPRARGGGARIVPLFAELNREGEVTRLSSPRVNYLEFDPAMAYFRMLFMARRTAANDHDIYVLAAPTQATLERQTRALEAGTQSCAPTAAQSAGGAAQSAGVPGESSEENKGAFAQTPAAAPRTAGAAAPTAAGAPESACVIAPSQVAIVAFLPVTVQGKEVRVHPGAVLGHALSEAGLASPAQVLPTLLVRKLYEGRLTPVEFSKTGFDILALPLSGGEEIRW
jgi:hypothetical protein